MKAEKAQSQPLTEEEIKKSHPYDTAKANFLNWAKDLFKANPPKSLSDLDPIRKKMEAGLTTSDLNAIIEEVGGKPIITPVSKAIDACNQSDAAKQKSIAESKKLIEAFKEKLGAYPKYLSYEGSVVLCVMVSINETNGISLSGLPQVDRDLIISQLPPDTLSKLAKSEATISVEFNESKDFILTYQLSGKAPVELNFFNAVIHPQKLPDTNVPVEKDGDSVKVGSALVLDRKRIERLVGNVPPERAHEEEDDDFPRRQPVSGRNAYEIRTDVLQMAFDWAARRNKYTTPDDIIGVAKKFYTFVEDRNRR